MAGWAGLGAGGRWARKGGREGLPQRQPHRGNLLQLIDDDFLRDAPELFVLAVAQLGHGHVDGALMVGNHHRDEVLVDVAAGLDRHVVHHLRHGGIALRQERGAVRAGGRGGGGGQCEGGQCKGCQQRQENP